MEVDGAWRKIVHGLLSGRQFAGQRRFIFLQFRKPWAWNPGRQPSHPESFLGVGKPEAFPEPARASVPSAWVPS